MTNATHDQTLDADALVLCRGSLRGCSVESFLDAAADAGFDGVSLYFDDVASDPARVRALLDDHCLRMAELDGPMQWTASERNGPSVREMLDAAAIVRARSVTVIETAGHRADVAGNWNAYADAFGAVGEECAIRDLLAHIEFFPLSGIASFADAARVVALADHPAGGVLLDTWHFVRGPDRGMWPDGVDGRIVTGLQCNDAAADPDADLRHEMMHGRLVPGDGVVDLTAVLADLRARGCTAPLGVEVYSDDLEALPPVDAARRLRRAIARIAPAS